jgi:hypothetical protein
MNSNDSTDGTTEPSTPGDQTNAGGTPRLIGTRACLRCHHELSGQPIHRIEPEGLLIVRCTECGQATPILEYPILGRWGARIGSSLLLLHVLVALGIVAATGAACFGVATGITQTPYRNLRTFITSKWETFGAGRTDVTEGTDGTWNLYTVDLAWWNDAGPGILVEYQAQHGMGITSLSMVEMGGFVLLGTAIGVLWAGLFAGVRWSRLWIPPVALYFVLLGIAISATSLGNAPKVSIYDVAEGVRFRYLFPIALFAGLVGLEIGVMAGRPVLRVIARLLLPPNRQRDIDFLWRVDKKR